MTQKRPTDVEVLETKLLLDEFFHIEILKLRHTLISGEWSPALERYILHRPDAVCAVVHNTEQDCIYLVKQFRPAAYLKDEGWLYELAAGLVDNNESKEDAIRREVMEELGFQFEEALLLNRFFAPL